MTDKNFIFRIEMEGGQPIIRQLDDIGGAGERAGSKIKKAVADEATPGMQAFTSATKAAGQALIAFVSIQGLTTLISHIAGAAERFDDLGDSAQRLGTSAGELVKWQESLRKANGEMEDFIPAADAFQGKIGNLIAGVGKNKGTAQALSVLGLSREDMASATTLQERLLLIADAISKIEDRAVRAGIADKLGLRPMLPLLEQGRAGIEGMTAQFKSMGDAAQEGVDATGDLADKMASLQREMTLKSDNMFIKLAPLLTSIYGTINNIIDAIQTPAFQAVWGMTPVGNAMNIGAAAAAPGTGDGLPFAQGAFRAAAAQWKNSHTYKPPVATVTNEDLLGGGGGGSDASAKAAATAARDLAAAQKLVLEVSGKEAQINAKLKETLEGLAKARKLGVIASDEEYRSLVAKAEAEAKADLTAASAARNKWLTDANAKAKDLIETLKGVDFVQEGVNGRMSAMSQIISGNVRSLNDLLGVLVNIVSQFAQMAAQGAAKGEGSFFSIFGDLISGALGFGGGGGAAKWPGGWASGGYTGAGGKHEPAGIVHRGEYVMDAATTRRFGVGFFDQLRGYAGGGLVVGHGAVTEMVAGQARAAANINVAPPKVDFQVINQGPPMEVETRQTRGADGSIKAEAILKPIVTGLQKENIAAGRTDNAFRGRFGARPLLTKR